jgi:hypothetical protein
MVVGQHKNGGPLLDRRFEVETVSFFLIDALGDKGRGVTHRCTLAEN